MRGAGPVRRAVLGLTALVLLGAAASDDPAERLKDPAKEARARALFKEIRCLVCQNESIDESDADLAGDLRRIVREKVAAGADAAQIKRFLVGRYGEFVLERPTFSPANAVLWGAPVLVILGGGAALLLRRRRAQGEGASLEDPMEAPLTPQEEAALAALSSGAPE